MSALLILAAIFALATIWRGWQARAAAERRLRCERSAFEAYVRRFER